MDESWVEHKGFKQEAERPHYIPFPEWWYREAGILDLDLSTLKSIKRELYPNRTVYTKLDESKESKSISPEK